jgi:hypothetical protein
MLVMPRAIIFRDLVGKLKVLNVECDKCGGRGRYRLHGLIERYGIDAKMLNWEPEADCSRKIARNEHDPLTDISMCSGDIRPWSELASRSFAIAEALDRASAAHGKRVSGEGWCPDG